MKSEKGKDMFKWVFDRFREPSSWAGLAAIVLGINGTEVPKELGVEFWTALGVVVTGLIAVAKKDRK